MPITYVSQSSKVCTEHIPQYPELESPTEPVLPVGIVTWIALGKAALSGTVSTIAVIFVSPTVAQAVRAVA